MQPSSSTKNLPLSRTEWIEGVAWWTFDDPAGKGRGIVQAYINGKVTGNLKKFVEAQRTIKQTLNHN
jgi:hypothetical protein